MVREEREADAGGGKVCVRGPDAVDGDFQRGRPLAARQNELLARVEREAKFLGLLGLLMAS